MKIISGKIHGYFDYIGGTLILISPFFLAFVGLAWETYSLVGAGALIFFQALTTRFRMGVSRMINLKTHLVVDVIIGILLAVSPWLFGFAERVFLPHVIFGATVIVVAALTDSQPHIKGHPIKEASDPYRKVE